MCHLSPHYVEGLLVAVRDKSFLQCAKSGLCPATSVGITYAYYARLYWVVSSQEWIVACLPLQNGAVLIHRM